MCGLWCCLHQSPLLVWQGRGEVLQLAPLPTGWEERGHIRRQAAAAGGANVADGREFRSGMMLLKLAEIMATRIFDVGELRGEV